MGLKSNSTAFLLRQIRRRAYRLQLDIALDISELRRRTVGLLIGLVGVGRDRCTGTLQTYRIRLDIVEKVDEPRDEEYRDDGDGGARGYRGLFVFRSRAQIVERISHPTIVTLRRRPLCPRGRAI